MPMTSYLFDLDTDSVSVGYVLTNSSGRSTVALTGRRLLQLNQKY
ncbi:hypothetical protein [Microcoleus sp. FACHB-1515]|nr:hypothetical protein [Microcoleus sp. FACHB-1515]